MKAVTPRAAAKGAAVMVSSHLLALVEDLCTHLLILHRGRSLYFGPSDAARSAFQIAGSDTSLEEVFFRITENDGTDSTTFTHAYPVVSPTNQS